MWTTYNPAEDGEVSRTYSMEAHSPKKVKVFSWEVCAYCGLVYLRNDFTRFCIKMGCNYKLHREYNNQRNMAGGHN